MSIVSEAAEIFSAVLSNDAWMISEALKTDAAWVVGAFVTLIGGALIVLVYHYVPWIERSLEATIMTSTYLLIGAIIFVEVFRRFVLNVQAPWSTTLPPFLFLIMTWMGCAYNVKLRTHLAFSEFRMAMPRPAQFLCLTLDALLWLGFSWVVVVTSTQVAANSAANFQIMLGTDNVLQWWFLISVPLAFLLIAARAMENWLIDVKNLMTGKPLTGAVAIGSD
ncbi:TRAP transporter small permease subunit [Roseibium porphyridii]|uniref:TRAP transporter small permease protein n=1 Tax=Roseibium porphyridii TaxID=2866279 RepID=A0ABY8F3N7_9HYPH|nr:MULTISPECIES: TRAP transporter small permease subunit [Stappiaceae]QFT33374.1 Tripartite ATP-independent periplasmic transporter, DctQ component [Labrenzia sp. THAF82]WFE88652.1 TRAP transporter small permease subunit [Roseibium sp. KMA01]